MEGQVWGSQNFANAGESRESQCADKETMWPPCKAGRRQLPALVERERKRGWVVADSFPDLFSRAPAVNFLFLDLGLLECYTLPHFQL